MKKVGKKLSALIAMTLMLAMMVAMGASAAEQVPEVPVFTEQCEDVPETVGCIHYSESIINQDQKTSLSVYKYSYSGEAQEGNGHYPPNIPEGAVPLEGVVFTYLKVADLVHVNEDPVRLEYNLTEDGAAVFDMTAGQYSSDELNAALAAANGNAESKAALEQYVAENGTDMAPTNAEGVSSATGLDQGLYLVAETQVPGAVYERINPFLVSLPMTNATDIHANNKDYGPGELWQYDVFVFPKNKTEIPSIEKNILDNEDGESEKYESLGVGDTVTYQVTTEVPDGAATMSRFSIADTMSEGLTFTGIQEVRVGGVLIPADQYDLFTDTDAAPYTFILELVGDDYNHLIKGEAGDAITVKYTAELNDNCIVTEEGNPNHATLIYNHDSGVGGEGEPQIVEDIVDPKVYTYGIDLTKVNKADEPVAGVEFDLFAADKETQIFVTQKESTNEAYAGVNSYYPNGTKSGDKIVTGEDGRAYIWGLAPGTYYLKETKTVEGYTLQKDLIEIKIGEEVTFHEADAENRGTYVPIDADTTYYTQKADGSYVAFKDLTDYEDGTYINFGTDSVFVMTGENTYEKVQTYYPTVKADIEVADPFGVDGMNVLLKVLNNADFDLPGTGGMGTYVFTIGGAVILLAALGLIVVRRKKNLAR